MRNGGQVHFQQFNGTGKQWRSQKLGLHLLGLGSGPTHCTPFSAPLCSQALPSSRVAASSKPPPGSSDTAQLSAGKCPTWKNSLYFQLPRATRTQTIFLTHSRHFLWNSWVLLIELLFSSLEAAVSCSKESCQPSTMDSN